MYIFETILPGLEESGEWQNMAQEIKSHVSDLFQQGRQVYADENSKDKEDKERWRENRLRAFNKLLDFLNEKQRDTEEYKRELARIQNKVGRLNDVDTYSITQIFEPVFKINKSAQSEGVYVEDLSFEDSKKTLLEKLEFGIGKLFDDLPYTEDGRSVGKEYWHDLFSRLGFSGEVLKWVTPKYETRAINTIIDVMGEIIDALYQQASMDGTFQVTVRPNKQVSQSVTLDVQKTIDLLEILRKAA